MGNVYSYRHIFLNYTKLIYDIIHMGRYLRKLNVKILIFLILLLIIKNQSVFLWELLWRGENRDSALGLKPTSAICLIL